MKESNGKILGVIGGMGPMATQLFYKMVIEKTVAESDQEHLNMIILNHATMPDRTKAILEGNTDEVLKKLAADGKYLEHGGADAIAIPCNTSHVIIDRLSEKISVPIINMVRCTADRTKKSGAEKAGILATDGTIRMDLYQNALKEKGIEPYVPSDDMQKLVMKIIYDGIKKGHPIDYADFEVIEKEMKSAGCDKVLLACTELSCFRMMYDLSDYYIDAMDVLAEEAIVFCGKNVKKTVYGE